MYQDTIFEYELQTKEERVKREMRHYQESSSQAIHSLIAHSKDKNKIAEWLLKIIVHSYHEGVKEAEMLTEYLELDNLHFFALDENERLFTECLEDREEFLRAENELDLINY